MTAVPWNPVIDIKCDRRRCAAVAHVVKGNRGIVIECDQCRKYERGNDPKLVETAWADNHLRKAAP